MSTVTCPNCKTKNTEGSKFCNRCGAGLPISTHITCPNCQVRNPRSLLYCDNCGTRLAQTGDLSFERKEPGEPEPEARTPRAFSLPARDPGDELDPDNLLDWLKTGGDEAERDAAAGESTAEQESVLDDWLSELSDIEAAEPESGQELPDWFQDEAGEGEGPPDLSDWFTGGGENATDEGLMDWLSELEGEPTADTLVERVQRQSSEPDELAGWLEDFDESEAADSEAAEAAGWLNDFETAEETPTLIQSTPEPQDEEELPDWLNDFGTAGDTPTLIQPAPEPEEEGLPDWLSDYDQEETVSSYGSTEESAAEEGLPDWLRDFNAGMESTEATSESAEELPEWLSDLNAEKSAAETAEPSPETTEELPEWLSGLDSDETAAPTLVGAAGGRSEEDDFAAWLSDFNAEEGDAETAGPSLETAEELPEWLSGLDSDESAAPAGPIEGFEDEDDFAAWLSDFNNEQEEAEPAEFSFDTAEEDQFPDWLSGSAGEKTVAGEMESLPAAADDFEDTAPELEEEEEGDLPDWLSEMPSYDTKILSMTDEDQEEPADLLAEFGATDMSTIDERPDWLSEVAPDVPDEAEPAVETPPQDTLEADDDGLPAWLSEFPDEAESLEADEDIDWLAALTQDDPWPEVADEEEIMARLDEPEQESAPLTGPSQELKGVPRELAGSGLPDWLQDDMPPGAELFEDEGEDYFGDESGELVQGEIPDWLKQMRPSGREGMGQELELDEDLSLAGTRDEWQGILEDMPPGSSGMGARASSLSSAEIPAWLQALKPRDFGKEDTEEVESDEPPETDGPLAGMRGVLPVAPVITEPVAARTPVQYTVSKEQQQQISLLHQLTHEEQPKTKQVSHKKDTTFSTLGRGLLGLLLLLVVLAGLILPGTGIALPETALPVPDSALDTYNTLQAVSGRTILFAFDYTPAMAGEMDPIALMLMRQMAANGNRIVTISQSAAGTAVAERLVEQVEGVDRQALPLLTGEAVGLRTLGACLNAAESCDPLYDTGNAELMGDLADIGLVIVLTSDRSSLINWIEQVESQNETPVVAAVTQPLGPLTIPYLSSGQLEGSLNGIPAASAYEKRLLGQDGSAFAQFTAQTVVMWVVIVALIAAALFYGLAGFAGRGGRKGNG